MRHRKETYTAALFLALLVVGLCYIGFLFLRGESTLREELGKLRRNPSYILTFVESAETALNEDLDHEHGFIQLYGGFQRLTERRVLEDVNQSAQVVRLSTGALNFAYLSSDPADMTGLADSLNTFGDNLAQRDIPLLFVAAPQKVEAGKDLLPPGLTDYNNPNADQFLSLLEAHGTDTVDLRPLFEETEDYSSWFFRTDHHWKPEAAFYAWQSLTGILESKYGIVTESLAVPHRDSGEQVWHRHRSPVHRRGQL